MLRTLDGCKSLIQHPRSNDIIKRAIHRVRTPPALASGDGEMVASRYSIPYVSLFLISNYWKINVNEIYLVLWYGKWNNGVIPLRQNESMPSEWRKYSTSLSISLTLWVPYMIYEYIIRFSPILSNILTFACLQDCLQRVDQRANLVSSLRKWYASYTQAWNPFHLETGSDYSTQAPTQDLSSSNMSPLLNVFGS